YNIYIVYIYIYTRYIHEIHARYIHACVYSNCIYCTLYALFYCISLHRTSVCILLHSSQLLLTFADSFSLSLSLTCLLAFLLASYSLLACLLSSLFCGIPSSRLIFFLRLQHLLSIALPDYC